jgi:hypothetical protein
LFMLLALSKGRTGAPSWRRQYLLRWKHNFHCISVEVNCMLTVLFGILSHLSRADTIRWCLRRRRLFMESKRTPWTGKS